jgi:hypothetical protein
MPEVLYGCEICSLTLMEEHTLRGIWKNKNIRIKTKLKICNSNVKAILLYGCETWKVTNSITQKLRSFINRCLRRILNVRWPDVIETTGEKPIEFQVFLLT